MGLVSLSIYSYGFMRSANNKLSHSGCRNPVALFQDFSNFYRSKKNEKYFPKPVEISRLVTYWVLVMAWILIPFLRDTNFQSGVIYLKSPLAHII